MGSLPSRLARVAAVSTGFVYLVSRMGVTGTREQLSLGVGPLVEAVRAQTTLPVAVGFGISNGEQAGAAAKLADGVVVGSALVKVVETFGSSPDLEAKLEAFARELKAGMEPSAKERGA